MRKPKVPTETIIEKLAEGKTMKEIAIETDSKNFTIGRQVERLKQKNGCKTITQLVVKLKLSGISTT
jgi:DNA-binding NarL/FixJ family response regulator